MQCEVCGARAATIRITEKLGDVQRIRHLCEDCWRAEEPSSETGAKALDTVRCAACEAVVPSQDIICPNCLVDLAGGDFDVEAYRKQLAASCR